MKQIIYGTERFDKEGRHFGGRIYLSDFSTVSRGKTGTNGSTIAARIESDFRWEQSLNSKRTWTNHIK